MRIESSSTFIDRVNGNEPRSDVETCVSGSLYSFDEQVAAESLPLLGVGDREPRKENHPNVVAGKSTAVLGRKRLLAHTTHRECVVTDDGVSIIDQEENAREVSPLVLLRMIMEPGVECLYTAREACELVVDVQSFNTHSINSLEPPSLACLLDEDLWGSNRGIKCIEKLREDGFLKLDGPVSFNDLHCIGHCTVQKELGYRDAGQSCSLDQHIIIC